MISEFEKKNKEKCALFSLDVYSKFEAASSMTISPSEKYTNL